MWMSFQVIVFFIPVVTLLARSTKFKCKFFSELNYYSLSDCEEEPLVPGHVDAVQRQLTLPVVWQVTLPWEGVGRVGLARVGVFSPL